jgi:hypothetical protein
MWKGKTNQELVNDPVEVDAGWLTGRRELSWNQLPFYRSDQVSHRPRSEETEKGATGWSSVTIVIVRGKDEGLKIGSLKYFHLKVEILNTLICVLVFFSTDYFISALQPIWSTKKEKSLIWKLKIENRNLRIMQE